MIIQSTQRVFKFHSCPGSSLRATSALVGSPTQGHAALSVGTWPMRSLDSGGQEQPWAGTHETKSFFLQGPLQLLLLC